MIRVEAAVDDPNQLTADDKKIEYEYDYRGRRISTRVYAWETEKEQWETEQHRRFMYYERMRILTLDDNKDVLFKLVWGPDRTSAGSGRGLYRPGSRGTPLGQLLAVGDDPNSVDYVCVHDGAGNLGQIAKRSDGELIAKYDYNGQRRRAAVLGECEDPNSLDDCDQWGPCFLGYWPRADGSFYTICGCAH
ncbi:MAG: hypothetical protein ACE5I3_09205 [Phycisphaerae bacterium]